MTAPDRVAKGLYWDQAWGLISGCTPVSEGCEHCWAAREAHARENHPSDKIRARNGGLTEGVHFNGQIRLNTEFLDKPLRRKKPTVYAVWNDLFHEDVPDDFRHKAFATMRVVDHHIYLILTKRAEEALRYLSLYGRVPLSAHKHIWIGVTAENQEQANHRIPILLQIPAAVRFVSVEPMLGPVDVQRWLPPPPPAYPWHPTESDKAGPWLGWVVCGGESGPGARPMHPEWVRSLRDQCVSAGVPFFFKQWGEWVRDYPNHLKMTCWQQTYQHGQTFYRVGKKNAGRLLDGVTWDQFPGVG